MTHIVFESTKFFGYWLVWYVGFNVSKGLKSLSMNNKRLPDDLDDELSFFVSVYTNPILGISNFNQSLFVGGVFFLFFRMLGGWFWNLGGTFGKIPSRN